MVPHHQLADHSCVHALKAELKAQKEEFQAAIQQMCDGTLKDQQRELHAAMQQIRSDMAPLMKAHAQQQRGAPLHAVVLESAYTSMRLASSQYPVVLPFRALPFGRSIVWRYFRKSADELDTQARITDLGCPVLLLHGAADIMVPMEPHSKALAIGLKEAAKSHVFVPLPDAGHLDVVLHPTLLATLVDFFEGSSARDGGKGALEP